MIDQKYCVKEYNEDYIKRDRLIIDNIQILSDKEKADIRRGIMITRRDKENFVEFFYPIEYDWIEPD